MNHGPAFMGASLRRKTWHLTIAMSLAFFLVAMVASPARANSTSLSQSGTSYGTVYAYNTPRTNTFPQNYVSFTPTGVGPGGGGMTMGLRNAGGTQFARGVAGPGQTVGLRNTNGNIWQPGGTFYLNVSLSGACGGPDPCPLFTWSANFSWNVRYA